MAKINDKYNYTVEVVKWCKMIAKFNHLGRHQYTACEENRVFKLVSASI